ncbi:hypothetical protein BO94DRAFT_173668 [Aspergillus sclerotioniger CBS 115572]|uniref:Uncharacterized protein n=1 Tax=Aspergillus sclerotioniger CBS 115572 TaxID=1450535 RepID=A0A317VYR3_9EURO|nr:hypothetical protein BO94DRAFT_173668 [Aspergillus sclerotioniger CBS 115572]PWY79506.1 hypothetical protein BO94DRAFT_173668 [Aspergillus sclerotioniger CBS 115572]
MPADAKSATCKVKLCSSLCGRWLMSARLQLDLTPKWLPEPTHQNAHLDESHLRFKYRARLVIHATPVPLKFPAPGRIFHRELCWSILFVAHARGPPGKEDRQVVIRGNKIGAMVGPSPAISAEPKSTFELYAPRSVRFGCGVNARWFCTSRCRDLVTRPILQKQSPQQQQIPTDPPLPDFWYSRISFLMPGNCAVSMADLGPLTLPYLATPLRLACVRIVVGCATRFSLQLLLLAQSSKGF